MLVEWRTGVSSWSSPKQTLFLLHSYQLLSVPKNKTKTTTIKGKNKESENIKKNKNNNHLERQKASDCPADNAKCDQKGEVAA